MNKKSACASETNPFVYEEKMKVDDGIRISSQQYKQFIYQTCPEKSKQMYRSQTMSLFQASGICIIKNPEENEEGSFDRHKLKINYLDNEFQILDGKTDDLIYKMKLTDFIGVQEFRPTPSGGSGEPEKTQFIDYFQQEDSHLWRFGIKIMYKSENTTAKDENSFFFLCATLQDRTKLFILLCTLTMMNRDNLCFTYEAQNEEQTCTKISPYCYTENLEKGLPSQANQGERIFLSDPIHSNPDGTNARDIDDSAFDAESMRISETNKRRNMNLIGNGRSKRKREKQIAENSAAILNNAYEDYLDEYNDVETPTMSRVKVQVLENEQAKPSQRANSFSQRVNLKSQAEINSNQVCKTAENIINSVNKAQEEGKIPNKSLDYTQSNNRARKRRAETKKGKNDNVSVTNITNITIINHNVTKSSSSGKTDDLKEMVVKDIVSPEKQINSTQDKKSKRANLHKPNNMEVANHVNNLYDTQQSSTVEKPVRKMKINQKRPVSVVEKNINDDIEEIPDQEIQSIYETANKGEENRPIIDKTLFSSNSDAKLKNMSDLKQKRNQIQQIMKISQKVDKFTNQSENNNSFYKDVTPIKSHDSNSYRTNIQLKPRSSTATKYYPEPTVQQQDAYQTQQNPHDTIQSAYGEEPSLNSEPLKRKIKLKKRSSSSAQDQTLLTQPTMFHPQSSQDPNVSSSVQLLPPKRDPRQKQLSSVPCIDQIMNLNQVNIQSIQSDTRDRINHIIKKQQHRGKKKDARSSVVNFYTGQMEAQKLQVESPKTQIQTQAQTKKQAQEIEFMTEHVSSAKHMKQAKSVVDMAWGDIDDSDSIKGKIQISKPQVVKKRKFNLVKGKDHTITPAESTPVSRNEERKVEEIQKKMSETLFSEEWD